jgi:hypothetical protein
MLIKDYATTKPDRSDSRKILGGVSCFDDGQIVLTTPNEKCYEVIKVLCGVLGITELEYIHRYVRSNWVYYYRIKGEGTFYTKADFTVILSRMLDKQLQAGQTLK